MIPVYKLFCRLDIASNGLLSEDMLASFQGFSDEFRLDENGQSRISTQYKANLDVLAAYSYAIITA